MKYKESKNVELKRELTKNITKEVIAFANTEDGVIYIGVEDDGNVIGVENPEKVEESVGSMIRDSISPDLTTCTEISIIKESSKSVICVEVQSGTRKPYYLKSSGMKSSGVFVRHGTSSAPASDDVIRDLIVESDGKAYDKMRSLNQDLTFEYAEEFFRKQDILFGDAEKRTLKLINDNSFFTNAGLLLSDQCDHIIKCAVAGQDSSERFRDRQQFGGSIIKQLQDSLAYINLSNQTKSTIGELLREDSLSYPKEAIREALLNAVIHRDYDMSSPIIVNIFPDEIEIISLGSVHKGLTFEDISSGVSHCRNEVIANVFYRLGLIEMYGTGIRTILKSYADFDKKPEFTLNPKSFIAKLPNRNFN